MASLGTEVTKIRTEACWTHKALGRWGGIMVPARTTEAGKTMAKAQTRKRILTQPFKDKNLFLHLPRFHDILE